MAKEQTKGQKTLMKKLKAEQAKRMGERARKKIAKDSGTLTSRIESAKKSAKPKGGLPAIRKETLPAVRKDNLPAKVEPGRKDIVKRDGGSRSIVKRESGQMVVRDGKGNLPAKVDVAKGGGGGAGGAIRKMLPGAWRAVGGPAAMLVSMTTPTGDGQEDKPTGPLMKGGKQPGYKYRDDGVMSNKDAEKQYRGIMSPTDYPRSQPRDKAKAPIPKARPARDAKPRAAEARKSFADKPKAAPKPSFRGNWVGAAPTAMQARGGARIKRRSLRDLVRGER